MEEASLKTLKTAGDISIPKDSKKTRSTLHLVVTSLIQKSIEEMSQMVYWNINFQNFHTFCKKADNEGTKYSTEGFEATLKVKNGTEFHDWLIIKKVK